MPIGIAVELGEAGDERRAVQRLELVEVAVVDDPGDDVARVERHARVGRRDAEHLLGVEARRPPGATRAGAALALVEPADDLPAEADAVELVDARSSRRGR